MCATVSWKIWIRKDEYDMAPNRAQKLVVADGSMKTDGEYISWYAHMHRP